MSAATAYTPAEQAMLARIARDVRLKPIGVLKRYLNVNGIGGFSNTSSPLHIAATKLHRDELERKQRIAAAKAAKVAKAAKAAA